MSYPEFLNWILPKLIPVAVVCFSIKAFSIALDSILGPGWFSDICISISDKFHKRKSKFSDYDDKLVILKKEIEEVKPEVNEFLEPEEPTAYYKINGVWECETNGKI